MFDHSLGRLLASRAQLLVVAILCVVVARSTSAQIWHEAYCRGDVAGSLAVHRARLLDGDYSAYAQLADNPADQLRLCEEIELRAFSRHVASHGDYPAALATIDSFLERPHAPSVLAVARYLRARYLWHCGQPAAARRQVIELGVLSSWSLIGPFDNDRGSGFEDPNEPEEDPYDPDERYLGKRDYVSWRQWEEVGVNGTLRLDELLRPNDEALAYLQTHIYSPVQRDIVIRADSTGQLALWWNGAEVLRRDCERPQRFGQEVVVVRLGSGWNKLLVKSGHTGGPWGVRIRLTDHAGNPLVADTVRDEATPDSTLAQQAVLPAGAPVAKVEVGPEGINLLYDTGATGLLGQAVLRTKEPQALESARLLRGWLIDQIHQHDRNANPDRELYVRALADNRQCATAHYLLALTYKRTVEHTAEREENRWRVGLERVLDLERDFDRARFQLADYYLKRFGNYARAEEILRPVEARPSELLWRLQQRLLRGRYGTASSVHLRKRREALLESQPLQRLRIATARRWADEGRASDARKLLEAGLEFDATHPELRQELTALLVQQDDLPAARQQVEERIAARPNRGPSHLALVELESAAEDWPAALSAIDAAIVIAPDDEEYRRRRGDLLRLLGQERGALLEYRRSLDLEPNQPRLREYIELSTGTRERLEDEHRLPTEEIIAKALATEDSDMAVRVLLQNTAVRIEQDGTTTRYVQYVAKIVTDEGARLLDYYNIPYASGEQWVKVLTAQVHRKDGTTEEARIRNREPFVRDGEYPVWSQAWVDLPALEPGDVIEIDFRREDLRQSFFGDYFGDSVPFAGLEPWDHVRYSIIAPEDKKLYFHDRGLGVEPTETSRDGLRTWTWERTGQERLQPEPSMPPLRDVQPMLEVSSIPNWEAFNSWYYHLIRKQFESSPAIRQKVAELTADLGSPAEKARAIYNFIVQEIRYIAWEFGIHGFKPYNASAIFTRRFGDCKDKATLLCTMLAEVGIDAFPVLIHGSRNRHSEDLTLPLVSHFNHCIAYIPSLGPDGHFVDGTAEHHSFNELPLMDRGAEVLIVGPEQGNVRQVAWNHASDFSHFEHQLIQIEADGDATITVTLKPRGEFAVALRERYEVTGQHREILERHYGRRFPGARLVEAHFSDLRDLNLPVKARIEIHVPRFLDAKERTVALPPIVDFFQSTGGLRRLASRPARELDLSLGNPRRTELVVEVEFPAGYTIEHLPESRTFASAHAKFEFTSRVNGRRLSLERQLIFNAARVTPADYEEFRKLIHDVEAWRSEQTLLQSGQAGDER